MKAPVQSKDLRSRRGVVLIWTALLIFAMLGMLGLGIDLGRMYIVKGELQNYTDAAAFAAAMELNGLDSGLTRARTAASDLPNKWDFGTKQLMSTERTVSFAETSSGSWSTAPANSDIPDIAYVRVGARVDVPLYFAPAVGAGYTTSVAAETVAGKETSSSVAPGNLLPMAPMAPNAADPVNFGFAFGESYALRWSSNIGNNNSPPNGSACSGDLAGGWGDGSTIARQRARDPLRGYWGESERQHSV
jgi:Flp pilus assembly protein TadG